MQDARLPTALLMSSKQLLEIDDEMGKYLRYTVATNDVGIAVDKHTTLTRDVHHLLMEQISVSVCTAQM